MLLMTVILWANTGASVRFRRLKMNVVANVKRRILVYWIIALITEFMSVLKLRWKIVLTFH